MSNTTHVFAIGGTGARIVKSLTFLLAAGYPVGRQRTIKPIFLDPDKRNGDGTRTHRALTLYNRINAATRGETPFFKTTIESPKLGDNDGWSASMGVEHGSNRFQERINYHAMGDDMKDFTRLMFGSKLLETTLEAGYLGNPNIGTVAMNAVKGEKWFRDFAENFQDGDDIILVASIFGGTGAAGLPLMVKTLRNAGRYGLPNQGLLEKAKIGAVIVQPYFGVSADAESPINQNTFTVKTKAALEHYSRDIDAEIDVNYPIGDPIMAPYPNEKGGGEQTNPAHLVELIGALSIIDFANGREDRFVPFGTKAYPSEFLFEHFGARTRPVLQRCLTQYTYAVKYWNERMAKAVNSNVAWAKKMGSGGSALDSSYVQSDKFFAENLTEFNKQFITWLDELSRQQRKFFPINFSVDGKMLHQLIRGVEQKKIGFIMGSREWSYKEFDEQLNKSEKGDASGETPSRLLQLFADATSSLYDTHVPN